ncbi:STAS/SEC14 domain-containing protein [Pseudarthrobacter sp. NamE2]|uniref:DUF7793 family protein n=1 Tax=Pseudarthrobacter sp. NamE2 TaxID=2576838 RepID=UPI001485718B|nr:STAS/SEC14 domain-containing protein [Pseudarthrobacter sp. NamE2]
MRSISIADKGTLELSDGIYRLRWNQGVTVELEDTERLVAGLDALGDGKPLPLLIQVGGVTFTYASRKVSPPAAHVSRIALLGSSPVDQVIALFLFRFYQLPCPIKYFTSLRPALAWLRSRD